MKKNGGFLLNTYLLLAVVHVFLLNTDMTLYQQITKALLMPTLMIFTWLTVGFNNSRWLLLALLFCWAGDVLLIFTYKNELYFLLGLGAFLAGHLAYIKTFLQSKEGKSKAKIWWYAPILLYVLLFLSLLWNNLDDMLLPVSVYAIVIACMAGVALRRNGSTNASSFSAVMAGAILFVLSDSLIAWNKFQGVISNASLWIMLTYIMAQYLLVQGILWHKKNPADEAGLGS